MKILHVIDHWGLGGAQRVLSSLVSQDREHLHRIAVLLSHRRHDWRVPRAAISFLGSGFSEILKLPFRMRRVMERERPDVVHIHLTGSRLIFWLAMLGRKQDYALIWHEHAVEEMALAYGSLAAWVSLKIQQSISASLSGVVANSCDTAQFCCKALGLDESRVRVILCPINAEEIEEGAKKPLTNLPLGVDFDKKAVAFVGRLAPEKGWMDFIALAERVLAERSDCQFWIVGDGQDLRRFGRRWRASPARDGIVYWGARNDVFAILSRVAALVMPSHVEAFGLVALEAMQVGRPVIGYEVGGLREVLASRPLGIGVPKGDIAEAQRQLYRVLDGHLVTVPNCEATFGPPATAALRAWTSYYDEIKRAGR